MEKEGGKFTGVIVLGMRHKNHRVRRKNAKRLCGLRSGQERWLPRLAGERKGIVGKGRAAQFHPNEEDHRASHPLEAIEKKKVGALREGKGGNEGVRKGTAVRGIC